MQAKDMANYENQGDKLVKKAQKSLEGGFFKNLMTSKWERLTKAKENYEKAVNNYKLGKKCAETYLELAQIAKADESQREQAQYLSEAGQYYIKSFDEQKGIDTYKESVELFKANGNFDSAAALLKQIGEYFEGESQLNISAQYFQESAELYALTKHHVTDMQRLKLKVAQIYSEQYKDSEKLKKAFQIYEDVAYDYIEDEIGAQKKLEKYRDDDPSLNNSIEAKFLASLIKSIQDQDEENVKNEIRKLGQKMTLEKQVEKMLFEIKGKLSKQEVQLDPFDPLQLIIIQIFNQSMIR